MSLPPDLGFDVLVFFMLCRFFVVAADVVVSVSGSGEPGGVYSSTAGAIVC